jgi:hypothetical protein
MNNVYTSSFAGFVPAGHPDLTGIVVLDQTPYFGGVASAPVFSAIAGYGLRQYRIAPAPAAPPPPGVPLATAATAQAAGEKLSGGAGVTPSTTVAGAKAPIRPAPNPTTTAPLAPPPKSTTVPTSSTVAKRNGAAGATTTSRPAPR